jgi:hypothetical protein
VEFHNLYVPPDIMRMTESRRLRWKEHVAPRGSREMQKPTIFFGKPRGKDHLGEPSIDGKMI